MAEACFAFLLAIFGVSTSGENEYCCSQSFDKCGLEEFPWCQESEENCLACNAVWLPTSSFEDNSGCTPRWESCDQDSDCCEPGMCLLYEQGWQGCNLPRTCCGYDYQTCKEYDDGGTWCHESAENCEGSCNGYFIYQALTQDCTGLWKQCSSDDECCGGSETSCLSGQCVRESCCSNDGSTTCVEEFECNHSSSQCNECGGTWINRRSGGTTPVAAPAPVPTPMPIMAPAPVPISAPQPPVGSPTQPSDLIPPGYSERIVIPNPDEPDLGLARSNCPHLDTPNLLDWFSPSTWPTGSVPLQGANVQLPSNTKILINKTIGIRLGVLTIPASSSLIVGEDPNGIDIEVNGMDVQGELIIGSETCRVENPVTITLRGSRPSDVVTNVPRMTYKGIAVNGRISLHGKRYFRTWTRLAAPALPGDTELKLQHNINWDEGQTIVLVTTALKDSREWHQNEVLTIVGVSGTTVTVAEPVQYKHAANSGYQAEVGLLSRMVTVQGSQADSEPTDKDPLSCTGINRHGDDDAPCPYTEITGFGGHVIVYGTGKGYIEGVEYYRMGMTNALGRYPMHFHLLRDGCRDCYVKDSSFYRSYYRCISIHGTNGITVSENVAYDVTGFCYYLEDGVEEENTLSFNMAAFIHSIGPETPSGSGQQTNIYQQNDRLTLPADVTAAGFYITNVRNNLIGNSASGGWAGFAFPNLPTALETHKSLNFRPSAVPGLIIDGNTAHSTGWWWQHAGAFYFGGALYYNSNDVLEYNPGRSFDFENHSRRPCLVNPCDNGDCVYGCPDHEEAYIRITNTKAFSVSGPGLNSWSGTMEVIGYEAHDVGLSIESLSSGFWIDGMLAVCRTGETMVIPASSSVNSLTGNGFFWYDTGQEHIITNSVFRQCGYRSSEFAQYDTSPNRGCGDSNENGCARTSTVFGFLTHSDQFTPEIMQGTKGISFESCGRRFRLQDFRGDNLPDTVSGRGQNWIDVDGSASGLFGPTMIVSGLSSAASWLEVDSEVVFDPQGPLRFIRADNGPQRGMGHFRMVWDENLQNQVGNSICGNGGNQPCPIIGSIRHKGMSGSGLPVTAVGDIAGPVGGYGWILELDQGSPRNIRFEQIEVLPETPLLISIPYPPGTTFTISAHASPWCWTANNSYSCSETFQPVNSVEEVRNGPGNQYHVDSNGVVTFRIVQTPTSFVGRPQWFIPSRTDTERDGLGFAVQRVERGGVYLPRAAYWPYYSLTANCGGSGVYCTGNVQAYNPNPCPPGYSIRAYDRCCSNTNPSSCLYANGATEILSNAVVSGSKSSVPFVSLIIVGLAMAFGTLKMDNV